MLLFQDLKQPYQGQEHIGVVVESWPWFHIMDEAMQGHLYNNNLVLSTETVSGTVHHINSQPSQTQENTDILEFLIKTEMDDTVAADEGHGTVHSEAAPTAGVPMGWRRMTECSYKSRQNDLRLRGQKHTDYTFIDHVSVERLLSDLQSD